MWPSGLHPALLVGVDGYQVHTVRSNSGQMRSAEEDAKLKGKVFYFDMIHPDGNTGKGQGRGGGVLGYDPP